jgi:hypothetical protein
MIHANWIASDIFLVAIKVATTKNVSDRWICFVTHANCELQHELQLRFDDTT